MFNYLFLALGSFHTLLTFFVNFLSLIVVTFDSVSESESIKN